MLSRVFLSFNLSIKRLRNPCLGVVIAQVMVQSLNHLHPGEDEDLSEQINAGDGGVVYAAFGVFISFCVVIVILVVCRNKAKTRPEHPVGDRHVIQRSHTAIAGAIDVPTENSIANVPTATSMHLPIANATLTTPPASEDLDLPIAVAQPL